MQLQRNTIVIIIILFLSGLLISAQDALSQFSRETGFFPIRNFTPEDYNNAMPKNSAITQDHRGVMYFANDEGVLEYDGIRWRLFRVSNGESVHALALDQNGRVYVGAVNEFGYLAPNRLGELEYVSLTGFLPDSLLGSFTVWYIHCLPEGVYFQTNGHLFRWDGNNINAWTAPGKFHTSFSINNRILIKQTQAGFLFLDGDSLVEVKGDEVLEAASVYSIIPNANHQYFVVTQNRGFYNLKLVDDLKEIEVKPVSQNMIPLLKGFNLINGVEISPKIYSVGTWGSGLLIYQDGKILQLITKKSGLGDEVVNAQLVDKDGNLWLALSDGITKIEINSPLSKFTEELGVDGSIEAIARFDGKIYLATEKGLLLLMSSDWDAPNKIYDQNNFRKLRTFSGGLWDLLDFRIDGVEILLIASDNAIVQLDGKGQFKEVYECFPWRLYQSRFNPTSVFVGLDNGLAQLAFTKTSWKVICEFPEITEKVFTIAEDNDSNLWLGTKGQGIIRVDGKSLSSPSGIKLTRYNESKGLPPTSDIYLTSYENHLVVGTNKGLFDYNSELDTFYLSQKFPADIASSDRIITRLKPDSKTNLWATTFVRSKRTIEAGFVRKTDDGYSWTQTPFNTISKGDLFSIYPEDNGVVWFGGSIGLFRFDSNVNKNYRKDFAALIRLSNIGKDSTIFFGSYFNEQGYVTTIQPDVLKPRLKYRFNSPVFEFAAQNTEIDHPVRFSYYLEGYDKGWSDWSTETKRYYTNLFEGDYTFRVKAQNVYSHQSVEASYEFTILPPWYRTIVAYISYVLLLLGFMFLVVTQYTKYLRAVIREKTKEIREQKEIVEHKNEEITASIKYAQRIQEALLPPSEILQEADIDHFILFKPRDIVSGDFYWFRKIGDLVVIVAADCTGHGVPGAFVSMLGMAFLNEISIEIKEVKANEILNSLRALVVKSLRQTGKQGESKDGMDIALYVIDRKNMTLQFAGANNPLVIIRNKEIIQVKADRMPIGYYLVMDNFQNNEFDIQRGDMLYTFSDGYQDQFGGENASKFMIKKLKQLMVEVCDWPLDEQKKFFDETIEQWKGGKHEQIDDILLIGVRL